MFIPLLITLSAFVTGCSSCSDQQIVEKEQIEEDLGFQNNWGSWLGSGILSDGSPVLSYYDKTKGALGLAIGEKVSDGFNWTHSEVDGYTDDQGLDSGDRGKFSSLAVASDDRIWISYHDIGLKTLRYATRDPSTGEWETGVADTGGGGSPLAGLFSSIALDENQNPIIAHYDQFRTDLRVVHYNNGAFTAEIVDDGPDATNQDGETIDGNTGMFTDIIVHDGVEHIVYYDVAAGDLRLAYGTSGAYTLETIDAEGDVGTWPSITVHNGQIFIAYHDKGGENLKLATGTPGAWTLETVDNSQLVGADTAIHVDENQISIVYFDGQFNNLKSAIKKPNEEWAVTVLASDGALGYHNELIALGENVFAACHNYSEGNVWIGSVSE